jgi:serpin B
MHVKNELRVAAGVVGVVGAALLMAGCGAGPVATPAVAHGVALREPFADPRPYGAADTAFGLDVLNAGCRADPRANLVLSPSSLASGLGMAYLGARGSTAQAMAQVPLLSSPDRAAQEIDQAIAAATRGQIPELLSPTSLNGIALVLTDALYLRAAWSTPFQASQTAPGPFTTAAGQQATASFMNGGPYRTASAAGWTAVRLPYRGGKLAMVALLPPSGTAGCATPAASALGAMTARLTAGGTAGPAQTRSVSLPRVNLGVQVSLNGLLSELGMGVAFSASADFAGLSPQPLSIGLVQQAATLQVGEQGTVASAATAVGMQPTAVRVQPPQVVFDRPYLMLVTASATGEPLFIARVANPAAH